MAKRKCRKCGGSGIIETGNNDLPCDCPAGATALFNVTGISGPVTGQEVKQHFLKGSPQPLPIFSKPTPASKLPGRKK